MSAHIRHELRDSRDTSPATIDAMHTATRRTHASPRPTGSVDARIASVAALHHGVVNDIQLAAVGVNRAAVRRRIRAGQLLELMPHVYARVPLEQLTIEGRRAAALASMRAHPAALCRVSAARLHGIWTRTDPERVIDVLSTTHWRPTDAEWVAYHSTELLEPGELVVVAGYPSTPVLRTCLDLGMCLTEWQLASVLHEAQFRHGLDLAELAYRNEQRASYRGCDVVRRAIDLRGRGSAGTRSYAEDMLLRALIRAGVETPQVCTPGATALVQLEMDLVWPDLRLVVEVDGRTAHDRAGNRERDAATDAAFAAIGWRVVRVSADDVRRDVWAVVDALITIMSEQRRALA